MPDLATLRRAYAVASIEERLALVVVQRRTKTPNAAFRDFDYITANARRCAAARESYAASVAAGEDQCGASISDQRVCQQVASEYLKAAIERGAPEDEIATLRAYQEWQRSYGD